MSDNRPIGVFDSGLGGLTAVRELQKVLPGESILYFGDCGRVPYGTKSPGTIAKFTGQILRFLQEHRVKAIVAACGTVSSNAKHVLKELTIPYMTVIEPTADAAAKATANGRIGCIATSATIKSGAFVRAIGDIDSKLTVFSKACPLLVPLVENGFLDPSEPITRLVLEYYLEPLKKAEVDTLILGCTHYPLLERSIAALMGDRVKLIDSGRETARSCAQVLRQQSLLAGDNNRAQHKYYVSDSTEAFEEIAQLFLEESLTGSAEYVDIEKY